MAADAALPTTNAGADQPIRSKMTTGIGIGWAHKRQLPGEATRRWIQAHRITAHSPARLSFAPRPIAAANSHRRRTRDLSWRRAAAHHRHDAALDQPADRLLQRVDQLLSAGERETDQVDYHGRREIADLLAKCPVALDLDTIGGLEGLRPSKASFPVGGGHVCGRHRPECGLWEPPGPRTPMFQTASQASSAPAGTRSRNPITLCSLPSGARMATSLPAMGAGPSSGPNSHANRT